MAFEIAKRIISGRKAVTIPGTAGQFLADANHCYRVDLCADVGNADVVVVGDSNVVAASGSQKGITLFAGNPPITVLVDDVSKLWVDAISAGDAVCFVYYIQ